MTEPTESLAVVVTRIEGKINTLTSEVKSQADFHNLNGGHLQRGLDDLKKAIQLAREEARSDSTGVRTAVEAQLNGLSIDLVEHQKSINPHPFQEEWLRGDSKALAAEIRMARTEFDSRLSTMQTALDTAKGGGRVIWAIAGTVAVAAVGIGSALLTKTLGG